jgi:hypothetical protein
MLQMRAKIRLVGPLKRREPLVDIVIVRLTLEDIWTQNSLSEPSGWVQ